MNRNVLRAWTLTPLAVGCLCGAPIDAAAHPRGVAARAPFKDATMIIEYNGSAEDVGVQFFLDAEEWQAVKIFDPQGRLVFHASAGGSLMQQGGGTELFMESVEPELAELPLDEFFERFPEGDYRFVGRTAGGYKVTSQVEFTHTIPAAPEVTMPPQSEDGCPEGLTDPVIIGWDPVTETVDGAPVEIEGYEVIVENDQVFDVHLPADATEITVSAEFLEPGTEYDFEVLSIAEGGNQTITEGCFATAD